MDKNEWNVGEAKQQFSKLLRRSARQPQLIYRRNRLIAAVVAMDETKTLPAVEPLTLADRFDEIREVFRQEKARFRTPRRRDRKNEFVSILDELAGGHQRSE